jgi:3-phosphoglycerate kinase
MEHLVYNKEELKGKKVLVRVDFNVEIKNNNVTSEFRLKRTIPTIRDLTLAGAQVILIAHIDDKEGGTLEPVARYLVGEFPKLFFVKDIFSPEARDVVIRMNDGDVVLFENLRKWPGEKANDEEFAKHLASFADVYVDEAFSVAHRPHASIVGVPKLLPSFLGPAFGKEVEHLSKAFNPEKPFLVVLGGAKFETKVPLLDKFLDLADQVFVGGAIMNDFFKAKGYFVGDSLVSDGASKDVIEKMSHSDKLILPVDVVTSYKGEKATKSPTEVGIGERIMDVGEKSVEMLRGAVEKSKFVVWNGPLGKNESGFGGGTEELAKIIAGAEITSIVGGGDVTAVIEKLGVMDKFTFVSAGGGAMLDFLAHETLPGLRAIEEASHQVTRPGNKKTFFEKIKELF